MNFLVYVISIILAIKLSLFLLNLLITHYGKRFLCGIKWSSERGEFIVIAGATGPIGNEYAREFAALGFNLVLIARNGDKLKKLANEYKEKYQLKEIKVLPVDFNVPNSFEIIKSVLAATDPILALVNCMGTRHAPTKFADYPPGFNSRLLNVNIVAPILLIEMVLPRMVEQKCGVIINYSSMSGRFEFPYFSTFSASKAFISTLSEILSVEYGCYGIVVQNVEPLFVESQMSDLNPSNLLIPATLSVYTSMMEVGLETTTYGHWKHKLTALFLHTLVFIFGPRLTTKLLGCFIPLFVNSQSLTKSRQPNVEPNIANSTTLSNSEESTLSLGVGKESTLSLIPKPSVTKPPMQINIPSKNEKQPQIPSIRTGSSNKSSKKNEKSK